MGTSFSGISIGLNALRAFRAAQEVTGNNIANASTPGYVRQTAVLDSVGGGLSGGSYSGGVDVTAVKRNCDIFAQAQARSASGGARREEALRDILAEAEGYVNPLSDSSLSACVDGLWNSLQDLALSPSDSSARQAAVSSAATLADSLNDLETKLSSLLQRQGGDAATLADEVNAKLQQITELNGQIRRAESGGEPANSLRDTRDALMDEVAGYMDLGVVETKQGVILASGGRVLVSDDYYNEITAGLEGSPEQSLVVRFGAGNDEISLSSGRLLGMQEGAAAVQDLLDGVRALKASLSGSAAGSVNAAHASGYTAGGDPSGENFFTLDGSGKLQVNPLIEENPRLLAAALTSASGDGDGALAMADALKAANLDGGSYSDFLSAMASGLGVDAAAASDRADSAADAEETALNRRDSVSGVSLDEETARLLELQNSYAAAAKFVGVCDEMMDELISLVG